ncbi:MAG: antitoxin [Ruminococcaceae bacterium]|nr:antitoxin [Oscillospiraceae bacterium]
MAGKTAYKNKYNLENYDRINVTVNKGEKEMIRERATSLNMSINAYINSLIKDDLNGGRKKKSDRDMEIYLF